MFDNASSRDTIETMIRIAPGDSQDAALYRRVRQARGLTVRTLHYVRRDSKLIAKVCSDGQSTWLEPGPHSRELTVTDLESVSRKVRSGHAKRTIRI